MKHKTTPRAAGARGRPRPPSVRLRLGTRRLMFARPFTLALGAPTVQDRRSFLVTLAATVGAPLAAATACARSSAASAGASASASASAGAPEHRMVDVGTG